MLSIGEASEYLGISIDTLRRWEKRNKVEVFRSPGGHRYFTKSELDKVFGKKYERDERSNEQETTRKEVLAGRDLVSNVQKKEQVGEEKHKQLDEQVEENEGEEIQQETKRKLDVPRYIRYHSISKYEKLFGSIANRSTSSDSTFEKNPKYPRVTSFAQLSIKTETAAIQNLPNSDSILAPSTLTPIRVEDISKINPELGVRRVSNYKNFIIVVGVVALAIILVVLIISLSSARVLSPVP